MSKLSFLSGMKIVEMDAFIAAPTCGRILADWGADVINLESATPGGNNRGVGLGIGIYNGDSAGFDFIHTNKRSVSIDTRSAEGREVLFRLLEGADVFLTHIRDADMKRKGLSYDDLKLRFPRLIYAVTSGYGDTGPDAGRAGLDAIAFFARTGMSVDNGAPGQPPLNTAMGMGDIPLGAMMAGGILAAYIQQQRTGKGEKVVGPLYGGGIWMNALPIISAQPCYNSVYPKPKEAILPLFQAYQCQDGEWFRLSGLQWDRMWPIAIQLLGLDPELAQKYPDYMSGVKNAYAIIPLLEAAFLTKTTQEWNELFAKTDFPYEICVHAKDVYKDRQAHEAGFLENVTYPSGTQVAMPLPPIQFVEAGRSSYEPTRPIGSDTCDVLREAGYTAEEITGLLARNSVFTAK